MDEALRLADELDDVHTTHVARNAAAELRRLHAENERLHQINQSHEMKLSVRGYEIQIAGLEAQRDAMQERAEYWKRKHDDEETGAERYALRVQRDALLGALRGFVSCALPVSTEIDERGHRWTEAYLDQVLPIARAAISKTEGEQI